ncbi:hypothetical protein M409DRAFT_26716 [Zasmidium cellare ATCC 36951]|uniref:Uncharacterized protein n=1 Tax=Zasmidium cellare ATCC 36951 TaxID=1080233 RepID=A0A6A6C736_ZASCE|nr:uncharacterized protein M409DRAFT_26716 [Zasmidium cellare ATCC 36951]KAF2162861.1 hypothetical protein M409DRAFT_26716 [Zasmidium cellare ATCC 36951]
MKTAILLLLTLSVIGLAAPVEVKPRAACTPWRTKERDVDCIGAEEDNLLKARAACTPWRTKERDVDCPPAEETV